MIRINSEGGLIRFGQWYITWHNQEPSWVAEDSLPGFFTIGSEQYAIEFGDVDQGRPGIYFVTYGETGDSPESHPVLQF